MIFNNLFFNIDFWSALLGFIGSLLIFFFGFPPNVDPEGWVHLVLYKDEKEEKQASTYKKISYLGILCLATSFFLQIVKLFT